MKEYLTPTIVGVCALALVAGVFVLTKKPKTMEGQSRSAVEIAQPTAKTDPMIPSAPSAKPLGEDKKEPPTKPSGSSLQINETKISVLGLPEDVYAGQLTKTFFINGKDVMTLFVRSSTNINLSDVNNGVGADLSGILFAKEGDQEYKKYLTIQSRAHKASPYYLWNEGNTAYLTVVDDNGAGSGEGMMSLFSSKDLKHWSKTACYYFSGPVREDQDYYVFSQELKSHEKRPFSGCDATIKMEQL